LTGSLIGGHGYSQPVYTSYGGGGGTTVYEGGDTIVVNGTSEPATEYADQATTIADNYDQLSQDVATPPATATAPPSADVQAAVAQDWMPLGLYALTDDNSTADPTQYVQLVVSKSGAVGGELHDLTTDTSTPVEGAIDPQTQRVVWKITGTDTVMETGLYNLTQSETPVLIHDASGKTTQRMLARIEDPKLAQAPAQPAGVRL
jgi:hypothetical protein